MSLALVFSSKYFVRIAPLLAFKSFFVGAFEYLFGSVGLNAACDGVLILEVGMEKSPVITSKDGIEEIFMV